MVSSYFNYYEPSSLFHGRMSEIMGTQFDIIMIIESEYNSKNVWDKIYAELMRLNKMLNRFDCESEISFINSRASFQFVSVSDEMWLILTDCKRHYELTSGLFDITLNDFSKVIFQKETRSVFFTSPDISFDLGGYAKGYAVEKIKTILTLENIKHAFIDFGNSSIFGLGHHPYGNCWKVSIENPYKKTELLAEVELVNQALSTSGNMPSYTRHIIHPASGRYNDEKKIVSLTTKNSIDAEVLSTTLMISNVKEKKEILSHYKIDWVSHFNL